ncbi:MAG TPA: UDP-N-acetylmuramate dehydrogenase [Planctomycetaceae bacterium]|nr:UDP-N-acetylmuramate dehydrogenase [Planctomycetaceae bacterium]
MHSLDEFQDILLRNESLAPYTWLKVGGPAQFFLTPRSVEELSRILQVCSEQGIAVHLLGSGSNLLVRDEGVSGAVVRMTDPAFSQVTIDGTTVRAGAGALLSHVIAETVRAGLAGFENLSGIPGTIGGAIHGNAGGRHGEVGPLVKSVTLMDAQGKTFTRNRDELNFSYRQSGLDDLLVLDVTFDLQRDDPDQISDRLRKLWITKKASQPLSSQSAGCIFRNPRGLSAGELIEQAGLKGTRIGGAEVSDRHANFIVTHQGCTSADILRLMDLIRSKVSGQFGVPLETEVHIW